MKVFYGKQDWAKSLKKGMSIDVNDQVVYVPPLNSTDYSWLQFNITLPNQEKANYAAFGTLQPADQDPNPGVVMNVINDTGLDYLLFDGFTDAAWAVSKIYASVYLDSTYPSGTFEFIGLDNCDHYVVLFRGAKNDTQDRPFFISIQETWSEPESLLEFTPWSTSAIVAVAFIGSGLIVYDLNSGRKRRKIRHARSIRKNGKDQKGSKGQKEGSP